MKRFIILIRLVLSTLFIIGELSTNDDFPVLKGPYLGQTLPGLKLEFFAPGIISQAGFELHSSLTFTPSGNEIYFSKLVREKNHYQNVILWMRYEGKKWSGPEVAPFSGEYNDVNPTITPDGKRLYFSSNRPLKKIGEPKADRDIWFLERKDSCWSEPKHLDSPVNSEYKEGLVTISNRGTMYFYRNVGREKGWGEIYRSRLVDGEFSEPEPLDARINTNDFECFPVIAPDESYLIFYARNRSEGPGQYICFRNEDGTWSDPLNMGVNINGGALAFCSSFSPDRKYLFVLRRRNSTYDPSKDVFKEGIYWINAKIIDQLKPKELK